MKRPVSKVTGDMGPQRTAKAPRRGPIPGRRTKQPKLESIGPPFRFMDLPPELRELVYYEALLPIKPIDTAAIPNTPDRVFIQPIAQLSKQTRSEALHVLFRSRPVEISLHSGENVRRALFWAQKWRDHACALPQLIFSGRIAQHEYQFFKITLTISDDAPFSRASAEKAASKASEIYIENLRRDMLTWLETELAGVGEGREGKLSGGALSELIERVSASANGSVTGMLVDPKAFTSGFTMTTPRGRMAGGFGMW